MLLNLPLIINIVRYNISTFESIYFAHVYWVANWFAKKFNKLGRIIASTMHYIDDVHSDITSNFSIK